MPANITDVNAFTSPVPTPSDGDDLDAASVSPTSQALANRTAYLNLLARVRHHSWFNPLSPDPSVDYQAVSSATYVDVTSMVRTLDNIQLGDRIVAMAAVPLFKGSIGANGIVYGALRLRYSSPSFPEATLPGSEQIFSLITNANNLDVHGSVMLAGGAQAASPGVNGEQWTIKLQAKFNSSTGGATDFKIKQSGGLFVIGLKLVGATV